MRLLLTRPEPDASRTAAGLRARGHEVLLAPLLQFAAVANANLGSGPWAGVLMTSANAARAIAQHPRREELIALPVLAVGDRSAEAARDAGFREVGSAGGDADELLRLAPAHFGGAGARLLYLAGEDRAADLAGALRTRDVTVDTVVIYRMVAAEILPAAIATALSAGRIDGVLHYSRRSAETFLRCTEASRLAREASVATHYCLSAEVAAPLVDAGAARVRVAARPNEDALLALIGDA